MQRRALLSLSWGSLDQTLSASVSTRELRDRRFALVHMLLLNADYAPKFKDLVAELRIGSELAICA